MGSATRTVQVWVTITLTRTWQTRKVRKTPNGTHCPSSARTTTNVSPASASAMDYTLIPQPTEYHYSNTTHPLSYPFSTDPGAGAGAAVQSSPVPRISNELKVLLAWTKLTRPHNPAGLKPGTVIARNQGRHSLKVYKTTHDRTRSFILINRADWKCAMQQLTPCFFPLVPTFVVLHSYSSHFIFPIYLK